MLVHSLCSCMFALTSCVLNPAACLIFGRSRFDHINLALIDLHWLPCPQCITYKLWIVWLFECLHGFQGGNEFHSHRSMTKKMLLPGDVWTYGMERKMWWKREIYSLLKFVCMWEDKSLKQWSMCGWTIMSSRHIIFPIFVSTLHFLCTFARISESLHGWKFFFAL